MKNSKGYFITKHDDFDEKVFVLTGPWRDKYASIIKSKKIKNIRLVLSMGLTDQDLFFLSKLDGYNLRGIEVYNWGITDLTPLLEFKTLRRIGFECDLKVDFDFSRFVDLQKCFFRWIKGKCETIFSCSLLEDFNVVNYPFENLLNMTSFPLLRNLEITSRKLKALTGIERLTKLESLDLYNVPFLNSLDGIGACENIEELNIETCRKINSLDDCSRLKNLRKITFSNCSKIKTLKPLVECKKLEEIYFIEDTIVEDGDLSIFEELPELKKMWFANRRHYSVSQENISKILNQKRGSSL